jgi:general secretion pathway protein K
MVILMSVLILGFNYKSRACLRDVDDFRRFHQALNCATAGLNIAIAAVRDIDDVDTDKASSGLLIKENTFAFEDGKCAITITGESGKLNLNLLKDNSGTLNQTRIGQLLRLVDVLNRQPARQLHISYDLIPSIIDWTDSDDDITCLPFIKNANLGAESAYYAGLQTAYKCKNAPLDTIEELLMVKAVMPPVFERIRNYVTVYGDGKININCAPAPVIESLCEKMDPALARMIIDRRKLEPFERITQLRDVPGMTDGIYNAVKKTATVDPVDQYYRVMSRANVESLSCTIVAVLRRSAKTGNVDVAFYKEI